MEFTIKTGSPAKLKTGLLVLGAFAGGKPAGTDANAGQAKDIDQGVGKNTAGEPGAGWAYAGVEHGVIDLSRQ